MSAERIIQVFDCVYEFLTAFSRFDFRDVKDMGNTTRICVPDLLAEWLKRANELCRQAGKAADALLDIQPHLDYALAEIPKDFFRGDDISSMILYRSIRARMVVGDVFLHFFADRIIPSNPVCYNDELLICNKILTLKFRSPIRWFRFLEREPNAKQSLMLREQNKGFPDAYEILLRIEASWEQRFERFDELATEHRNVTWLRSRLLRDAPVVLGMYPHLQQSQGESKTNNTGRADGVYRDDALLVWGGVHYEWLTETMMNALELLVNRFPEKVKPSEMERKLGRLPQDGFKSIFKTFRDGKPGKHSACKLVKGRAPGGWYLSK